MKPAKPKPELRQVGLRGSFLLRKSLLGAVAFCSVAMLSPWAATAADYKLAIPFGLEETAVVIPADNPLTAEKVELGRTLFFDKRLSQDNTIACASCHLATHAFTDGKPVSTGIRGQKGGRSAPASFNRVFSSAQFWDGRAPTLEAQSVGPFTNPIEHGFANYDVMMAKMMKIPGYRKLFMQVFGEDKITIDNVGKAIASFQRALLVDPEDLQAHYNLMLCYQGVGDAEKASREQALYVRFKADEASQAITGPYRQLHPDDNNERQQIHEHRNAAAAQPYPVKAVSTSRAGGGH